MRVSSWDEGSISRAEHTLASMINAGYGMEYNGREVRLVAPDGGIVRESARWTSVEAAEVLLQEATGLDVRDPHSVDTPRRFVEMLRELTTRPPIKWKTFPNDGTDEMIMVELIPFKSLCQHHVVPFIGTAAIGYVPKDTIAGLSKFARVVQHFAAGLQVQERLTKEIADFLEKELQPRGVAVLLRAEHFCMTIRGVQVPGAMTTTSDMRGVFADHDRTAKMEFLSQLKGNQ
jgi:GTP cyclohydrolase I